MYYFKIYFVIFHGETFHFLIICLVLSFKNIINNARIRGKTKKAQYLYINT